jgi:hypothetical protein
MRAIIAWISGPYSPVSLGTHVQDLQKLLVAVSYKKVEVEKVALVFSRDTVAPMERKVDMFGEKTATPV